jgi:hypothetical protein
LCTSLLTRRFYPRSERHFTRHKTLLTDTVSTNATWQAIKRMPDGTVVQASYQGDLPSSAMLPSYGRFIGEEWSTGTTSWIWMTPVGASFASWVDP